jgi:hypothetical protein
MWFVMPAALTHGESQTSPFSSLRQPGLAQTFDENCWRLAKLLQPIDRELRDEATRLRQSELCLGVVPLRGLRPCQKSIGNKGSEPCINRSLKFPTAASSRPQKASLTPSSMCQTPASGCRPHRDPKAPVGLWVDVSVPTSAPVVSPVPGRCLRKSLCFHEHDTLRRKRF